MNLYHWNAVESLKNYSQGDIIVMAESIDTAKVRATARIMDYLKQERSWWFSFDDPNEIDSDSEEDYQEFMRIFERDLLKEPDLISTNVVFIRGSD